MPKTAAFNILSYMTFSRITLIEILKVNRITDTTMTIIRMTFCRITLIEILKVNRITDTTMIIRRMTLCRMRLILYYTWVPYAIQHKLECFKTLSSPQLTHIYIG